MGRKKFGFSKWSWTRASGLSSAKQKFAKMTGIPTTRAGRQRKVGKALGCSVLLILMLAFAGSVGAPCLGQVKKKSKEESFGVGIGFKFETKVPLAVAINFDEALEFAKSMRANDPAGIEEMLEEKRAIKLDAGVTLVVLKNATSFDGPYKKAYSHECRVIGKDGKSLGKYPVYFGYFDSSKMKEAQKQ